MSKEEEEAYRTSISVLCSALYIVLNTREEEQLQAKQYASNVLTAVVDDNAWLKTRPNQVQVH